MLCADSHDDCLDTYDLVLSPTTSDGCKPGDYPGHFDLQRFIRRKTTTHQFMTRACKHLTTEACMQKTGIIFIILEDTVFNLESSKAGKSRSPGLLYSPHACTHCNAGQMQGDIKVTLYSGCWYLSVCLYDGSSRSIYINDQALRTSFLHSIHSVRSHTWPWYPSHHEHMH
jgi:hypothetical protein